VGVAGGPPPAGEESRERPFPAPRPKGPLRQMTMAQVVSAAAARGSAPQLAKAAAPLPSPAAGVRSKLSKHEMSRLRSETLEAVFSALYTARVRTLLSEVRLQVAATWEAKYLAVTGRTDANSERSVSKVTEGVWARLKLKGLARNPDTEAEIHGESHIHHMAGRRLEVAARRTVIVWDPPSTLSVRAFINRCGDAGIDTTKWLTVFRRHTIEKRNFLAVICPDEATCEQTLRSLRRDDLVCRERLGSRVVRSRRFRQREIDRRRRSRLTAEARGLQGSSNVQDARSSNPFALLDEDLSGPR
jgi:hypothetical protein